MKTANKIVMAVAGAFLVAAAVLKSQQLLTEPIISKGFWESWEFFVIQIPLELGLGIWLLCGLFRKTGWLLAAIAFGGFIGVTGYKAITGAASCGCFGTVHVNPWITLLAIDVPLFVLLLIFQPRGYKLFPPPWPSARHFFGVAIPTFILLPAVVFILVFNKPPDKTDEYEVVKPQEWVVVKPVIKPEIKPDIKPAKPEIQPDIKPEIKPLINLPTAANQPAEPNSKQQAAVKSDDKEWPLLKSIDIADSLRSGIVVVLLYHYDCPNCREAIPKYDQMCHDLAGNEDSIKFAFVEIPPYGTEKDNPIPPGTLCMTGKLDSHKKWIFQTPVVVIIRDGMVVNYWEATAPDLSAILDAISAGN
jgi:thiol-disulfide isomerase/thioredoxin